MAHIFFFFFLFLTLKGGIGLVPPFYSGSQMKYFCADCQRVCRLVMYSSAKDRMFITLNLYK